MQLEKNLGRWTELKTTDEETILEKFKPLLPSRRFQEGRTWLLWNDILGLQNISQNRVALYGQRMFNENTTEPNLLSHMKFTMAKVHESVKKSTKSSKSPRKYVNKHFGNTPKPDESNEIVRLTPRWFFHTTSYLRARLGSRYHN